jgi:rfaE bifunctional protein nucleotidyltransferase chain/domain
MEPTTPVKLCPPADVARCASLLARPLVFTNGVFDIVHRGHVECLRAASRFGRSLVVGLNSDASVRRFLAKGPGRPLVDERDRAAVLDALECVTMIALFDDAKPLELLRLVRPDVYVKGGDYDVADLDEARLVASWGGRALTVPLIAGRSTSALVERILATEPRP